MIQIVHPTIDLGSLFGLLSSVVGLLSGLTVRGDYNIAGTYCEPEVDIPSRRNTLQLLAHPATYDRNYVSLLRHKYNTEIAQIMAIVL